MLFLKLLKTVFSTEYFEGFYESKSLKIIRFEITEKYEVNEAKFSL